MTSRNAKKSASQHYDCANFRKMIDVCGLSQAGLANLIDVNPATVSAWVTGKRRPPGAAVAYLKLLASIRAIGSPQ